MKHITQIILNRNFILIIALLAGVLFGDTANYIKDYTFYILAFVMMFATSGMSIKSLFPLKQNLEPALISILLNYVIFGTAIIGMAYILVPNNDLFLGFVVIAVSPPGVAIIPFSIFLKGNVNYSIVGVTAAFLASIFITPLGIELFSEKTTIDSYEIIIIMIKLILIPLILSRLLRFNKIKSSIDKIRGDIVNWGFAIVIFIITGLNRNVFLSDYYTLLNVSLVLLIGMIILGLAYEFLLKKLNVSKDIIVSQHLLLTIKSSGFSAVTALAIFGKVAAIPSAVLSVFVILQLLFLSVRKK